MCATARCAVASPTIYPAVTFTTPSQDTEYAMVRRSTLDEVFSCWPCCAQYELRSVFRSCNNHRHHHRCRHIRSLWTYYCIQLAATVLAVSSVMPLPPRPAETADRQSSETTDRPTDRSTFEQRTNVLSALVRTKMLRHRHHHYRRHRLYSLSKYTISIKCDRPSFASNTYLGGKHSRVVFILSERFFQARASPSSLAPFVLLWHLETQHWRKPLERAHQRKAMLPYSIRRYPENWKWRRPWRPTLRRYV